MKLPRVYPGERAVYAGRTGSGKTTGAVWLLSRSPGYWLILDKKQDKLIGKLGPHADLDSDYIKLFEESRIIVVRTNENNPMALDNWIFELSETYENIGLFIDELYYIHQNGRAGDGLVAWQTRGRSRNQSFIGCTQRPAWISRFCFSETDYIAAYTLALEDDRKRVLEMTGNSLMMEKLPKHYWRWYDIDADKLTTFAPVPNKNLLSRFKPLTK